MDTFEFKMNMFNLICITLSAVMFGSTVAAVLYKFRLITFCVCPRSSDDISICRLLLFFLQICNFWSDIYLLHTLYWISDIYTFTMINVILSSAFLFLIISTVLINVVFGDKWLFPWIVVNTNPRTSHWIRDREHNRWFIALMFISGSVYHSILMANSKMFGVTRTNMGLSTWNLVKILNNKYVVRLFYSYSLTVLVLQFATWWLAEGVYYANVVAASLTSFSMFIFTVNWYRQQFDGMSRAEKLEISYFHLVVEMSDYHNDDEYKVNQSTEMRVKWTQCIGNEVQRDCPDPIMGNIRLEVVAVEEMRNPNLQMFMIYCVLADIDSYWIQRMEECAATTLGEVIQKEFGLEQVPKRSLIKYSSVENDDGTDWEV